MGPSVAAVVVAAGRGLRAGGGLPKQYRQLGRRAGDPVEPGAVCLARPDRRGAAGHPSGRPGSYEAAATGLQAACRRCSAAQRGRPRCGPGSRRSSARAPDIVLVHDAARPFCSAELVSRAIAAGGETGAAIPALRVTDTIKRVDAGGHVAGTLDRAQLRAVQTPQAFAFRGAARGAPQRREARAARISPTTRRSPNGPGMKVATFAGESRQREAHHRRGFRPRRGAAHREPRATCAPASASTCTPSATAIMSGSAACDPARPRR